MKLAVLVPFLSLLRRLRPEPPSESVPMPLIVGAPRSGTTLLRLMLDAHRELAIPPETGFLIPALYMAGAGVTLRRSFFNLVTQYPPRAVGWQDFGIPADEFWHALARLEPFSVSAGLRCFYQLYAARFGKSRWGDKTPAYGGHMVAIEQGLPEAHFIHIIRDGRDVALSLRQVWFSPGQDMRLLAKTWRRDVSVTRAQGRRCAHYLEVRYEALVRNPVAVLSQICAFLSLEYEPQMATYYQRAPERLAEHQARVRSDGRVIVTRDQRRAQQRLTTCPPDPSRIYHWKRTMPREEREQFEKVAGPLLAELGYEVALD
jgi:hypothetical protein